MSIVETAIKVAEMQTDFDKIRSRFDVSLDLILIYADDAQDLRCRSRSEPGRIGKVESRSACRHV